MKVFPKSSKFHDQSAIVNVQQYSKNPFNSLLYAKSLKEFTVLDVQLDNPALQGSSEPFALADIEIIRNDSTEDCITVRSHLGLALKPGDIVLGYDLRLTSLNYEQLGNYDVCRQSE